jgi:hypothetical protein
VQMVRDATDDAQYSACDHQTSRRQQYSGLDGMGTDCAHLCGLEEPPFLKFTLPWGFAASGEQQYPSTMTPVRRQGLSFFISQSLSCGNRNYYHLNNDNLIVGLYFDRDLLRLCPDMPRPSSRRTHKCHFIKVNKSKWSP